MILTVETMDSLDLLQSQYVNDHSTYDIYENMGCQSCSNSCRGCEGSCGGACQNGSNLQWD